MRALSGEVTVGQLYIEVEIWTKDRAEAWDIKHELISLLEACVSGC